MSSTPPLPPPSNLLLTPPSSVICLPPPLFLTSATVCHSPLPSAAVVCCPFLSAVQRRPPPPSTHHPPPPPTYPPPTSLLLSTPVLTPHCKVRFLSLNSPPPRTTTVINKSWIGWAASGLWSCCPILFERQHHCFQVRQVQRHRYRSMSWPASPRLCAVAAWMCTQLPHQLPSLPSQHQLEMCLQCPKASACHLARSRKGGEG